MRYLQLFFLTAFLAACTSEKKTEQLSPKKSNEFPLTNVKVISPRIKINEILSDETESLLETNTSLHDLTLQLKKINTTSVHDLSNEIETVLENCDEFVKTLPSDLNNKSVLSRIDAIKNFAKAVAFETKKGYSDTTKLDTYCRKIILNYNSLIVQLNDSKNQLPDAVKKSLKETLKIKKDSVVGEPLF